MFFDEVKKKKAPLLSAARSFTLLSIKILNCEKLSCYLVVSTLFIAHSVTAFDPKSGLNRAFVISLLAVKKRQKTLNDVSSFFV